MTPPTTFMVDTTGTNADKLPMHLPAYGGYISGLEGVEWSAAQFARYAGSKVFRYYQGVGPEPPIHAFDVIDVEPEAVTATFAANIVRDRVAGGIPWTTIYGGDSFLQQVATDVIAEGHQVWNGHVNCILADWNLNETEAAALIGTFRHGMSVVGVQWASPSSNPQTFIPGTLLTLAEMNADLNVIDANWVPSGGFTPLPTPAPPLPVQHLYGILVRIPSGITDSLQSDDAGKTWHA
jgi:hypothetical protein